MKKLFFINIIIALALASCVKDENPYEPTPDEPENYQDIALNELICKDITDPYYVDASGNAADWVELYNTGNEAVNIAGMWISDKEFEVADYQQIPSGDDAVTTIPAGGYLVLICGATDAEGNDLPTQIADGKIFIDMGLSSSKDSVVVLLDPDQELVSRSANFGTDGALGGLPDDMSTGPLENGLPAPAWIVLAMKTPGFSNNGAAPVEGKLVLNEFMSSNDNIVVPGVEGDFPDWIEIYNTGDTPIDMGGWFVTDDLGDVQKYQLPDDDSELTTVPPHGFLLIFCDGLGEGLHANFKLSAGGEAVGISEDGENFNESFAYGEGESVPAPPTDFSAGLSVDGGSEWMLFEPGTARVPTPGASNN